MKAKGRIVNIKRYPSEGISFLTITIGGIKRFEIDDFLELRFFKLSRGKEMAKAKCSFEGPGGIKCVKKADYIGPYCETKLCKSHAEEMSGGPPYHCSNFDCKPELKRL